jgi:hypothetical protein
MPIISNEAVLALVDTERYPIHRLDTPEGQALVEQCRRDLVDRALCSLPGFLRPEAIATMIGEAEDMVPDAVHIDIQRHIGFSRSGFWHGRADGEPSFPPDHPVNQAYPNRFARLVNHQFSNEGPSRALFMWPALTEFVRQVFQAETMYRSQCPHVSMTMKIEGEGDTDSWHYDGNDGVVSLLLQNADEGGLFEYAPYLRSDDDQNMDGVAKVLKDPQHNAERPPLEPGTFVFFNGNRSLHRVTPVGRTAKPRMILLFSYDRSPNYVSGNMGIEELQGLPKVKDFPELQEKYQAKARAMADT